MEKKQKISAVNPDKTPGIELKKLPGFQFTNASRADNIYEVVKEGILRGIWIPGERIDDKKLAEELGVSRLSVREALSKLAEIRILEKKHWKGFQVRRLSWADVKSIIEIREALEALTIRNVVKRFTPQIETALEKSLTEAETDLRNHDVSAFLRSDFTFHEILYNASKNVWLADILKNLRVLIDLIRSIIQSEDFEEVARASLNEHHDILEALRAHSEEKAILAMNNHIAKHRERTRARSRFSGEKNLS